MRLKYLSLLCAIVFSLYGCLGEESSSPLTSASGDGSSQKPSQTQMVTVTYEANGGLGTMETQTVEAGSDFVLSKNKFTNQEHEFLGWSELSSSSKADYSDEAKVSLIKDTILYAIWVKSKDTVKVTFDSNGGTGYMPVLNAKKYTSINLPSNQYVRDGYIFLGWSEDSTSYEASYSDKGLLSLKEKDVTLYAVWKERANANLRTVTYNANGGIGATYSKDYTYGERIQVDTNKFTNGNKKFVGWSKNPTDRNYLISDNGLVYPYDDMTLYAVWSDNAHQITFNGNGGEGSMKPIYAENGQTIFLPNYNFTRWNYTLEGYTDKADDYMPRYRAGEDYTMGNQDVTLYIQWRIIDATIGGASQEFKGQTKYIDGVSIPETAKWEPTDLSGTGYDITEVAWSDSYGIYNVSQFDFDMCWAAVSSNVIHWWLTKQADYVKKYGKYTGPANTYNHYSTVLGENSPVFHALVGAWPNHGNKPWLGFKWFLSGHKDAKEGTGAYFKDVFTDVQMHESYLYNINKKTFNEAVTKNIKNQWGPMALTMIAGPSSHAITLWGAVYGDDGFINAIIITNSTGRGITKVKVIYDEHNNVFMRVPGRKPYTGIMDIISFYSGTDVWEEYFAKQQK